MTKTTLFNSPFIVFGILVLLIASCIILTQTLAFEAKQNALSFAITLDLLLTVPFIYYLLIRKKKIPKTTVVPVFILGIVITSFIIPKENQYLLQLTRTWVLPLVEFGVLSYLGFKIYKTIQLFKQEKSYSTDFLTVAKKISSEIAPTKIAMLLATELAVIYYGFFNWKRKNLKENEFSYHKNTGSITVLIAVLFIIFIETIVIHVLLIKWNIIVAWIISGLSIYTSLQIFALLKSIPKRPILIKDEKLYLKYGLLNETTIDIDDIESIEISTKEIEKDKNIRKLSPLGDIEDHNIILHLKKENILYGLYGINKKYTSIAFFVDEKDDFRAKLNSLLNL